MVPYEWQFLLAEKILWYITFMNRGLLVILLLAAANLMGSFPAAAREEVDSAEKLDLLQRATGATTPSESSSSSFQNRLNAILDTTPSKERTSVADQDAQARQQKIQAEILASATPEPEISESPGPDDLNKPLQVKDKTKILNAQTDLKVDGTQKAYDKERAEIFKEADEKTKKALETAPKPLASASQSPAAASNLPPSLANNPFYQKAAGNGTLSEESFETRKPLVVSRLIANGMSNEDAESLVSRASSSEELVLLLMQEQGYSFGQASDFVEQQ